MDYSKELQGVNLRMLLLLGLVLCISAARCQTWNEWFKQKQTKLEYITEQIAAFEMYAGYLKKAYDVVDEGWNVVDDIKHGDFDLHHQYFTSLNHLSEGLKGYDKTDKIVDLQLEILKVKEATDKFINDDDNIQEKERKYITQVLSSLLSKCVENLNELRLVTATDSLAMKDDERLDRIDKIYDDMQDKFVFAKHFQSEVQTLVLSRAKETVDIEKLTLLYNIK